MRVLVGGAGEYRAWLTVKRKMCILVTIGRANSIKNCHEAHSTPLLSDMAGKR